MTPSKTKATSSLVEELVAKLKTIQSRSKSIKPCHVSQGQQRDYSVLPIEIINVLKLKAKGITNASGWKPYTCPFCESGNLLVKQAEGFYKCIGGCGQSGSSANQLYFNVTGNAFTKKNEGVARND